MHNNNEIHRIKSKQKGLVFFCLSIAIIASLVSPTYFVFASPQQNKTLMQPQEIQDITTNTTTNIVLVHGFWVDGSSWSKQIPILENAGHRVIAVQLPLHSLADDIATVKRAIELLGSGPTILVGHSYGGIVITNAGYNNPNVTGLVYVAAVAPDEGQSLGDFFDITKLPKDFLKTDSGGFAYINPKLFYDSFAQDVDPTQADIMAVTQKPASLSILAEKSGPPAWKQLPTWYQVSENDRMIPPVAQKMFASQINATTLLLNASHASAVSDPDEIAQLILNATKGSTK
jgi:pimeloyl-ACP methyl ester carboxylesterase